MSRRHWNPITQSRDIEDLSAKDLLQLYEHYETADICAAMLGINRKTFSRYWRDLNLPQFDSIPKSTRTDGETYEILACSDFHLGSNEQQPTALLDFLQMGIDNNIQTLLIPGDIIEGIMKRPGADQTRFLHTIDKIYDYTASVFSKFADQYDNIWIVAGNHDATLSTRDDGFDILHHLAREFKTINYLETPNEVVKPVIIDGGVSAVLFHGDSACPCNLAARTRNITTNCINAGHRNLDFIFAGHCHKATPPQDFWLQVTSFSLGCFQSITSYLARKNLTPMVQGQRISYQTNKKGEAINIINTPYNYDSELKLNDR